MDRIDGNDNNTINGNNNHMQNIENIEAVNIYGFQHDTNKEKELERFFEPCTQKTPLFHQRYFYASLLTFIIADYFINSMHVATQVSIVLHLIVAIALWGFHLYLSNTLFDIVYIKENEVVIGQASFAYEDIRVRDISVHNGIINFGFVDSVERISINMHRDGAGLLRHKIEAYHRYYGLL